MFELCPSFPLCWLLGNRHRDSSSLSLVKTSASRFILSNNSLSLSHVSRHPEKVVNTDNFRDVSSLSQFKVLCFAFLVTLIQTFVFKLHLSTEMSSNMINVLKGVRHLTSATMKQAGNEFF